MLEGGLALDWLSTTVGAVAKEKGAKAGRELKIDPCVVACPAVLVSVDAKVDWVSPGRVAGTVAEKLGKVVVEEVDDCGKNWKGAADACPRLLDMKGFGGTEALLEKTEWLPCFSKMEVLCGKGET